MKCCFDCCKIPWLHQSLGEDSWCSGGRKLPHLGVPPTVPFNALPALVLLELFMLASQKGKPAWQTGQYQGSFTYSGKLSWRYSLGETPSHAAWVHLSHLEHSVPVWLFLTSFPYTTHGYLLVAGPGLTITSPARSNTKLIDLSKNRDKHLCKWPSDHS